MISRGAFVVITSQRTGSTLLVRSLDSSPDIFCAGEIFSRRAGIHHPEARWHQHIYFDSRFLGRVVDSLWGRRRMARHLSGLYANALSEHSAAGFKVMISQLNRFPGILPFLLRERVTCFYLYRRDEFATAVSYYKARQTGMFHGENSCAHNEVVRSIEANTVEFRKVLETCRADRDSLLRLHEKYGGHLLAYEDLVGRWDEMIAEMGDAVGLPGLSVPKALKKLGDSGGSVQLSNELALRAACGAAATR